MSYRNGSPRRSFEARQQTFIEKEILVLQTAFRTKYDAKTAFGNKDLIDIMHAIEKLVNQRDNSDECWQCRGSGLTDHDCNCDLCEYRDEECEECFGSGRVEKDPMEVPSNV